MKRIGLYDTAGKFVKAIDSVSEAAVELETSQPNISAALKSGGLRSGYYLAEPDPQTGKFHPVIETASRPKKGRGSSHRIVIRSKDGLDKKVFTDYTEAGEFLHCDTKRFYTLGSKVVEIDGWDVGKFRSDNIQRLDLFGEVVETYDDIEDVRIKDGYDEDTILRCASGKDNLRTLKDAERNEENTGFKHWRWSYKGDLIQKFPYDKYIEHRSMQCITTEGHTFLDIRNIILMLGKFVDIAPLEEKSPHRNKFIVSEGE